MVSVASLQAACLSGSEATGHPLSQRANKVKGNYPPRADLFWCSSSIRAPIRRSLARCAFQKAWPTAQMDQGRLDGLRQQSRSMSEMAMFRQVSGLNYRQLVTSH